MKRLVLAISLMLIFRLAARADSVDFTNNNGTIVGSHAGIAPRVRPDCDRRIGQTRCGYNSGDCGFCDGDVDRWKFSKWWHFEQCGKCVSDQTQ